MASTVRTIAVIGAGQMGAGIAQIAAVRNLEVVLNDITDASLGRGMKSITDSLARFLRKGAISKEDADAALARIRPTKSLGDVATADFVIEAVAESEELKRRIFSDLDACTPASTILASNTSSIPITRLAAATCRPEKVIGMHFMNPPPVMHLVEVVRGLATDNLTYDITKSLAERFGKTVSSSRDYPGFIVNRILMPMINEAFYALLEGVGTAEDIDRGMKLGTNQPMGPLTLADFIGLDTCLAIMRVLNDGLGDSKYRPCPLLVQYVDAGWVGKKSGRGVYQYPKS